MSRAEPDPGRAARIAGRVRRWLFEGAAQDSANLASGSFQEGFQAIE